MTIAAFIERDLQARLAVGEPPAALNLAALARHYRVSFSPVRSAIEQLVQRGVLLKQPNGRLTIGPRRPSRGAARWPTERIESEPWERSLAAEIIQRSLRGDADYLREEATAARFCVGRTALRQAFNRLAGQGLLEHVPRCGWRVRPFSTVDLIAYLEMRELLELKALELARPRLVVADLERMLAGNSAAGPGRHARLDNQLHAYLVEKSGNRYLADFFERHGVYFTTLFDYAAPQARVVAVMAAQHRRILRALIDRDWPRARRALAEHIRAQRPTIERLLVELQGSAHASAG